MQVYQGGHYPIIAGTHIYKMLPEVIALTLKNDTSSNYGIGLDFSKFDSSIQPWLLHAAFDILEENVTFNTT